MKAWIRSGVIGAIAVWLWLRQQGEIMRLQAELATLQKVTHEYQKEAEEYRKFKEGTAKVLRQYERMTAYRRRTHDDNPDQPASKEG